MNATCENMNPKAEVYSNCASKICSNSDEDSEGDSTDDQSMLNYIISFFCFNILFFTFSYYSLDEDEDVDEKVKFFVRLCGDVFVEVLSYGERRRLMKLERVGRRFHRCIDGFFAKTPIIRQNLILITDFWFVYFNDFFWYIRSLHTVARERAHIRKFLIKNYPENTFKMVKIKNFLPLVLTGISIRPAINFH